MMPEVDTAVMMPCAPKGMKPPPEAAVKFELWKCVNASTKMVSSGTPTFHHVAALFTAASFWIPRKFTAVNTAISSDRDQLAGAGQRAVLVLPAVGPAVVLRVADHRLHLDRRDGHRLQPGEPAERGPGRSAEGVVRVARGAAGHREHAAELGVHERQRDDRHRRDPPADQRGGSGRDQRLLRAVQPARPDDRPLGGPQQTDQADIAPQMRRVSRPSGRARRCLVFCHTRRFGQEEPFYNLSDAERVTGASGRR